MSDTLTDEQCGFTDESTSATRKDAETKPCSPEPTPGVTCVDSSTPSAAPAAPPVALVEAARYRYLRDHRTTMLLTGFFGNGCVNRTIEEVEAEIDKRAALSHPAAEAPASPAVRDVIAERERQQSVEGWTPEHDDEHYNCELALAAVCYATPKYLRRTLPEGLPLTWPWDPQWWKPNGARRDLVKAAALLLAEIERLDRAASPPAAGSDET